MSNKPKQYHALVHAMEITEKNIPDIIRWVMEKTPGKQDISMESGERISPDPNVKMLRVTRPPIRQEGTLYLNIGDFVVVDVNGWVHGFFKDEFNETYKLIDPDPGESAFDIYNKEVGGTTFDGKHLTWDMLGERQREGWKAVEAHFHKEEDNG